MLGWIKLPIAAGLRRLATWHRLRRSQAPLRVFGSDLHVGSRPRLWAPERIEIGDHTYLGHDVCIETNCRIGRFVLIADANISGKFDAMHVEIKVTLADGSVVGARCDAPLGSWRRPVGPDLVMTKARGLLEAAVGTEKMLAFEGQFSPKPEAPQAPA